MGKVLSVNISATKGIVPVICIVAARSGTGKTTFMEKLVHELVRRGYEVGTIKSDAHGFVMDRPGKDSWRFAEAGAKATAIIGPDKYALIQKTESKKNLNEVAAMIEGVDLILAEGYKASDYPRIEVVRKEKGTEIVSAPELLIAVVSDIKGLPAPVPVLDINDFGGVADLIVQKYFS